MSNSLLGLVGLGGMAVVSGGRGKGWVILVGLILGREIAVVILDFREGGLGLGFVLSLYIIDWVFFG